MLNSLFPKFRGLPLVGIWVLASILALAGCGGAASAPSTADLSDLGDTSLSRLVLEVPTVSCSTCWPRIEDNLKSVSGIKEAAPSRDSPQVVVIAYDPAQTTPDAIVQAIETGGDRVTRVIRSE